MRVAGLDIGGANIKFARGDSAGSIPFALWREPQRLAEVLVESLERLGSVDRLAVVMTAELCDCFESRRHGVLHVLDHLERATRSGSADVVLWSIDRQWLSIGEARDRPLDLAATNWLALAEWVAREHSESRGLVIDIGSTTSDLVAFGAGRAITGSRTDLDRLRSSELVYCGVGRTPVCALVDSIELDEQRCGVAGELFATTRDVYLTLGDLPEDRERSDTADGRPATREAARARLARTICADPPEFEPRHARVLAEQVVEVQLRRLAEAARDVSVRAQESNGVSDLALVCGDGEFLAARVAESIGCTRVVAFSETHGVEASQAACAFALSRLAGG